MPLNECSSNNLSRKKYRKLDIGSIVVLLCVIIFLIVTFFPSNEEKLDQSAVVDNDTTQMVVQGMPIEPSDIPEKKALSQSPQKPKENPVPQSKLYVPFGTYSGPSNGLNGEIAVTKSYSLDLRNAQHQTIELLPGDIITHTKFKDGELVSGYWHRGSEGQSFHR